MPSVKRIQVSAGAMAPKFAALQGDRLSVAVVGEYRLIEQAARNGGAINLNAALLKKLQDEGQWEAALEAEDAGDDPTVRNQLEACFESFLQETAGNRPRLLLWGLETLIHWQVNLRPIRQYAVNNYPVGLLLPGTAGEGGVRFYGRGLIDCEFDQIWEMTS